MGRSVASIRQSVKGIAERWEKSAKTLAREGDRSGARVLAGLVKKYSSDVFYGCNEPLEAAAFSALVEIAKALDVCRDPGRHAEEPGPGCDAGMVRDREITPVILTGTGQENNHVDP